ncbi:MAG: hypothetical protein RMY28_037405 [Nostoc sp. ChiSLP01]|nr:hypothetical protein [Nostoc sp. CmiSLP01]MDZ8287347.1 hypothetical protein [Nostoc sp. ChiSLP01]
MSSSSTISNLQQALNCAGKCDCCANLQSQINDLKAKIAGLKPVDENRIIQSTKAALEPGIASAVAGGIAVVYSKLEPKISDAKRIAVDADAAVDDLYRRNASLTREVGDTKRIAVDADAAVDDLYKRNAELGGKVSNAQRDASTANKIANNAITDAAKASRKAFETANDVTGLKGLFDGLKSNVGKLTNSLGRLEKGIAEAVFKAGEAVGISRQALGRVGTLALRVADLFNAVATIFTLLEQLAVLETLGARIDAVENQISALGDDVSRVLGKLLGLQNRINALAAEIPGVRDLAREAILIGNSAANIGRNALQAAGIARVTANQAQTTADGAVRNASRANENATTAFNKANEAKGIGEQAKGLAGQALQKGVEALGLAVTAISLYQGIKYLKGLKGDPGLPGRPGRDGLNGRNGLDGRPGRDGLQGIPGITQIIQIPGRPGRDGRNGLNGLPGRPGRDGRDGLNGLPGRNGVDAMPYNDAGLRAFIAAQHAGTRANSNAQHLNTQTSVNTTTTTVVGALSAFVTTQFGIVITALTTIGAQLLAFINWAVIDRVLNLITVAVTIHNGVMLSNDIGQTLLGAIGNILQLIGIKNSEGQAFDIGAIIGGSIESLIKTVIGENNYTTLTAAWQTANRIYQATTNVLNNLMNVNAVITNALEVIGSYTGKIGNALRAWGVVAEKAYSWMNPQPNFDNKWITKLQQLQEGANTVAVVAQIPVDAVNAVTELNNSATEFVKAVKQEPETQSGLDVGEAAKVKEDADASKLVSAGTGFDSLDSFNANE